MKMLQIEYFLLSFEIEVLFASHPYMSVKFILLLTVHICALNMSTAFPTGFSITLPTFTHLHKRARTSVEHYLTEIYNCASKHDDM